MTKVLVVAPRFPAINQPWMDTYLAQLQIQDLPFVIYSANEKPEAYQQKVDQLGLREHVLPFRLCSAWQLVRQMLSSPVQFIKLFLSQSTSKKLNGAAKLVSSLKRLYFEKNKQYFEGVSLIHAHEEIAGYEFLHLARLLKVPLVVTFHGLPPEGVAQLSMSKRSVLYRFASKVIVNTNFSKDEVIGLGVAADKVVVQPQGLPIQDFPYSPMLPPQNGALLRLVSVGRFHRGKGQHYLLIALRRLVNEGVKVELNLVGVGSSGKQWLQSLTEKLGLQDRVAFHENLPSKDISLLFRRCHLFVLASTVSKSGALTETQGVVIQEAQSSGLIPIVTNVGGIPECVADEENAILIKDRSSRAIFNAVTGLIDRTDDWARLQSNARRHVEENFSDRVIGEQMRDLLVAQSNSL
ncbi:hypothetical protein A3750_08495 [Oleiphilus sp. HI0079]|uniref:glycosyltransferase family 4 protein n=1 Tax=Oleiphilus sp. HI0079 TaxID=1822254 RepID=UPI0007C25648|nr:glycosyltransferase family 4 protein [Oleiphilus sp. HI0079]KZZ09851.1 hypothetical protein A3750_08495 [Oleiphilus sp. HI0079]